MAKFLARSCPRCSGYLAIVLPESKRNIPLQAINGRCLQGNHRLAWILIRGKELDARRLRQRMQRLA